MFCQNCGFELDNSDTECPKCKIKNPMNQVQRPTGYNSNFDSFANTTPQSVNYTNGNFNGNPYNGMYVAPVDNSPAPTSLKVLSFFIPLVGIILYCVEHTKKPVASKSCLTMSLVSIALYFAFCIFLGMLVP